MNTCNLCKFKNKESINAGYLVFLDKSNKTIYHDSFCHPCFLIIKNELKKEKDIHCISFKSSEKDKNYLILRLSKIRKYF